MGVLGDDAFSPSSSLHAIVVVTKIATVSSSTVDAIVVDIVEPKFPRQTNRRDNSESVQSGGTIQSVDETKEDNDKNIVVRKSAEAESRGGRWTWRRKCNLFYEERGYDNEERVTRTR